MLIRCLRNAARHRGVVTVSLVAALLVNLLVIGSLGEPPDIGDELPMAAHCQGGGPGCAEQPLIPPPAGGLPQIDGPVAPAFGALVLVFSRALPAPDEAPPLVIERPPALTAS
jgi:hypothetical protein